VGQIVVGLVEIEENDLRLAVGEQAVVYAAVSLAVTMAAVVQVDVQTVVEIPHPVREMAVAHSDRLSKPVS